MTIKHDIQNRDDITFLIDEFYKRVITDEIIGYFFSEIVVLNWEKHIPVMYDFWESMLLGTMTYKGNPMIKHLDLNKKEPILPIHFERWLYLWRNTISENFSGLKADEAINRATLIAELMQNKIKLDTVNI